MLQQKTQRPVQFEITRSIREALEAWIESGALRPDDYLFPSRLHASHTNLESTVRYLGIEVDDALEIAEQTEV